MSDETTLPAEVGGDWRATAEWDWVERHDADTDDALHALAELTNAATADEDWHGVGTVACGQHGAWYIPGVFTRMSAPRCGACCEATGMPPGDQSPKNVDECRPVVERRLEALRRLDEVPR